MILLISVISFAMCVSVNSSRGWSLIPLQIVVSELKQAFILSREVSELLQKVNLHCIHLFIKKYN